MDLFAVIDWSKFPNNLIFAAIFHGLPLFFVSLMLAGVAYGISRRAREAGRIHWPVAVALNTLPLLAGLAYVLAQGDLRWHPAFIGAFFPIGSVVTLIELGTHGASATTLRATAEGALATIGAIWGLGYGYLGRLGRVGALSILVGFASSAACAGFYAVPNFVEYGPGTWHLPGLSSPGWKALTVSMGVLYLALALISMWDAYRIARAQKGER